MLVRYGMRITMIPNAERELTYPRLEREMLVPEKGIFVETPAEQHAGPVAAIYRAAYERGDFFAGRYDDPERQIFSPDWLAGDFRNPDHHWFVFTNEDGEALGVTGFFRDGEYDGTPLLTSDETQVDPRGRGMNIMDRFFRRVVPELEASGAQLVTEFVLSPETKGLRRTLQSELGMVATGILPHALRHPELGHTRTEIAAAKPRSLDPRPVRIRTEYAELYDIARAQLPELSKPIVAGSVGREPMFTERYESPEQLVPADDLYLQDLALESGYQPVAYDPQRNGFTVARFPADRPDLGFIFENEQIEANARLVEYLQRTLYRGKPAGKNGEV